jgi:hypothetical protein
MSKLAELLAQKEQLEKQIEAAKVAEQADAIKQIVELAKSYGISYADLKPHMTKRRKRRSKKAEIEATKQ